MNDQDSFYVNITSDANGNLYPGNKTSDFRVQLPETLNLESAHWQVGLATLQYPCDINNIGPSVGTELYIWDGFKEHELEFPNWHCQSIENLTAFLNDAVALCLNPNGILSGEKALQHSDVQSTTVQIKQMQDIRVQKHTPSPAFLERQRLQTEKGAVRRARINIIDNHSRELERVAKLISMSQVKTRSDVPVDTTEVGGVGEEEEEEEEEEVEGEEEEFGDNLFDVQSVKLREKRMMRPINRYIRKIQKSGAIYSATIPNKAAWHQRYFDNYKYTQEPDYYPVTFKVDKLNRTTIECESPTFDIGMSDSLSLMLGVYEQRNFSMAKYRRRRKFMDILKDNIRTLETIQGQYVNPLARQFLQFKYRIKDMVDIATVLNLDFRRLWQHVRLAPLTDTVKNSTEITLDAVKGILNKPLSVEWPRDDPVWREHLDNDDFYNFVREVQVKNRMVRRDGSTDSSLFGTDYTQDSLCGLIVAMYMLKTIYTETLLGAPLYAQMPGQMNPHEFMQVYLDVVRPEPFNGFMTSLLALVKTEGRPGETARYEATRIQYKSLAVKNISCLKVLILSPNGRPIPFQRGPVLIQLHFTRNHRNIQLY